MAAEDDTDKHVEMWRIKNLIKQLDNARGNGTSMISLIIPPRDQISRVNKMLGDEMGTAAHIKSRVNRLSVLGAITSTQQMLKRYNRVPPNGLALYCGTITTDEGKEKKVAIDLEPFKPINTSLYLCDNKFHTEALKELLESDEKYGFVIMDGSGTVFGTLVGNTRTIIHKVQVDLPKKHGRGGQSAVRFARLRVEKRQNYVRKIAELCAQLFITNDKVNVSGLILAGLADFKVDLSESGVLDQRIKVKIIKLVDVSYGGEAGFNQAIELSADALVDCKFIHEKHLLMKYFAEIAQDTGKYCYGIKDTLDALDGGAVETLIVWENLDMLRFQIRDKGQPDAPPRDIYLTTAQSQAPDAFIEKKTGSELEVLESMPAIEFFANNYKKWGTHLEFISDRSTEGSQFCKGFGGIGGLLRYKPAFVDAEVDAFSDDEDDLDAYL